jgi:DNA-binding NarL/FixJ family response regulator
MTSKVRVIIVDDHEIFRDGLKFILSQILGYDVIGEAGNGNEFLDLLEKDMPDVVLMDISMPEMDGVVASENALKKHPHLKIIALSSYGDEHYYYKMIKAGVMGYVLKKSGKEELEKAIQTVLNGDNYFSPLMLQKIIVRINHPEDDEATRPDLTLSKREKEVLKLISQGYSNNDISQMLFISPKTVDNHRTSLLSKTSTRNAASLVMFAIKNNIIEI